MEPKTIERWEKEAKWMSIVSCISLNAKCANGWLCISSRFCWINLWQSIIMPKINVIESNHLTHFVYNNMHSWSCNIVHVSSLKWTFDALAQESIKSIDRWWIENGFYFLYFSIEFHGPHNVDRVNPHVNFVCTGGSGEMISQTRRFSFPDPNSLPMHKFKKKN